MVIDDAPEFLALVTDILLAGGFEVLPSMGNDLDVETLAAARPDLVVLDLRLRAASEQLTGMEYLRLIRAHRVLRLTPVVVCSADVQQLHEHRRVLARDPRCWVLPKPFTLDRFEQTVRHALGSDLAQTAPSSEAPLPAQA
jgi:CheY-like chemotaxis protein